MKYFRYLLSLSITIPVFLVLLWFVAVPTALIKERIEDTVLHSGNSRMRIIAEGLRKGIFLALHADSLDLYIDDKHALRISNFASRYSPASLTDFRLGFNVEGNIGKGDIKGTIQLPLEGKIKIYRAELAEIPYLTQFGVKIGGSATSDVAIESNLVKVVFDVPDLNIDDSASVVPLLNTFRSLQGALSIEGNIIRLDSVSLEGEKGYARLKGSITGNTMNLELELMPDGDRLSSMESMLIGRYIVSPGYYVVPIRGPLP